MSYDNKNNISNNELIEEVIFLLDNEIKKNPNAKGYGVSINYIEFKDKNITDNVELLKNYYNNKGFEVFFENDIEFGVQKIRLRKKII